MKPEWVALLVAMAFLAGTVLGLASAALYIQWEQKLSGDEARWRRISWQNRLDARRDGRRWLIEHKGKSQW